MKDPDRADPGLYLNVDWSRTRAYGLGLNGLYINLAGREERGIVSPVHHVLFDADEEAMAYGAAAQVLNALAVMKG